MANESTPDGAEEVSAIGAGERFYAWRERKLIRWSIIIFLATLALTALGTVADWQGAKPVFPCWAKGEQRISDPYGIAVANIAISNGGKEKFSDSLEARARDINESLFKQISSGFAGEEGKVGVGRTCNQDVQSTREREAYLAKVLDELNGDIVVSMTLTPTGHHVKTDIELAIGSNGEWNEAQELAGYYMLDGVTIEDSLEFKASILNASVTELLSPYIELLRAIASYASSEYKAAIEVLDKVLTSSSASSDLKKLAYVLKGNSQGRLGGPGSIDKAALAFKAALAVDKSYARAMLGLAEVDYQTGLSSTRSGTVKCDGQLTPQARSHLDAAVRTYEQVYSNAGGSGVPDVDVRAKYGIGRTYACMLLLGDSSKEEPAVKALEYVTGRFESDDTRSWLWTSASGAYGDLGMIYCRQGRREDAIRSYKRASDLAVDDVRRKNYDFALRTIGADWQSCL
ncbi:tetratricopeptide repeat protein [Paractinoplanes rhizophilus]|uniref:Tetratricopeptide repeat protein n=1 Tax=Paractinoplanes rhizophilus TaxID=1416877 RepID=A0ABW2I161_9ACTN